MTIAESTDVLIENGVDPTIAREIQLKVERRNRRIADGDNHLAALYEAVKAAAQRMSGQIESIIAGEGGSIVEFKQRPEFCDYQRAWQELDRYEEEVFGELN